MSPNRKPYDKGNQIPTSTKSLAVRERLYRERGREKNEKEEKKRQRQGRRERRGEEALHSRASHMPLKLVRKL